MPGRFIRLPAKDSYAYYVVTRVTKKTVKLTHIPYGPAYESNAVQDGEAELQLIERTLIFYDKIETQFDRLGRAPVHDKATALNFSDTDIIRVMRLFGLTREEAIEQLMRG